LIYFEHLYCVDNFLGYFEQLLSILWTFTVLVGSIPKRHISSHSYPSWQQKHYGWKICTNKKTYGWPYLPFLTTETSRRWINFDLLLTHGLCGSISGLFWTVFNF
jgi:hypothetical protein